ncbi:Multiple antibiotic resistance protein MarR [Cupriavidus yeoncheonensis]|uniref:Multiple antibiotic resistance protein MarR n=1 Tax=Cupriavidus yeoncheonensis TaxID=1462994 RepID=A0A916IS76_9BURK|nr:MarR family transcriptional regulator [Cupriavidus yeoncheonensis]CAG2126793.1 Multiple antibiotic resistance protein MarR [Cupriavidus yeoncheonensis]
MSPDSSATSSSELNELFDPQRYVMADSVGYLISRAKNTLAHSIEQEVSNLDITHAQASCLIMISSGRASTVTDLGRELSTDMGSITRLLSRMEKRGLIQRTRRDDDRRVLDLSLTPAGHALAAQLPEAFCKVMAGHFRGFSAEEIETLRGMLRRVICNNSG